MTGPGTVSVTDRFTRPHARRAPWTQPFNPTLLTLQGLAEALGASLTALVEGV